MEHSDRSLNATDGKYVGSFDCRTKGMTKKDKLEAINRELEILIQFCVSKGFTDRQIGECVSLVAGTDERSRKPRGSLNRPFLIVVAIAILFGLCLKWEPAYNQISIHTRIVFAKIFKAWDWQGLYNMDCLVDNAFLPEAELSKDDCQTCLEMTSRGIDRLHNVSALNVTTNYLLAGYPVILEDGLKNWPRVEHFSVEHLAKIYKTRQELSDLTQCNFFSTVKREENVYDFIRDVEKGDIMEDKFYTVWENCKAPAAKFIRRSYKRPYFLSQSTELSGANFLHVGKGIFHAGEFYPEMENEEKIIDSTAQGSWLAVVSGTMQVRLTPLDACAQHGCKNKTVDVHAGEIFAFATKTYLHNWVPHSEDVTVAVSSDIFWFE